MNAFGKSLWIGQSSVKVDLRIESSIAPHHLHGRPAEPSNVGEKIEMVECDLKGLHSAHGKTGHGTMIAVGHGSEVGINIGDKDLGHIVLECLRHLLHRLHHLGRAKGFPGQVGRGIAGPPGVTVSHDNDHWVCGSGRDQVVEDEVRMALLDPPGFVFPAAVLQVEHRVAHLRRRIVAWRRVHQRVPPVAGHARVVPDLPNLAVGNVLWKVIGCTRFRNLDRARVLAAAVEGMAAGIAHFHSVDDQRVVVPPRSKGWSRDGPESVRLLLHIHFRTAPEIEPDLRSIWSFESKLGPRAAVYARIDRTGNICSCGLEITRFLCATETGKQEHCYYDPLHLSSPRRRSDFRLQLFRRLALEILASPLLKDQEEVSVFLVASYLTSRWAGMAKHPNPKLQGHRTKSRIFLFNISIY